MQRFPLPAPCSPLETIHRSWREAGSWKREALLRFPMRYVLPAEAAELAQLEPFARLLLVLRRAVIPALTFGARQRNDVSHNSFQFSASSFQRPQLMAGSWWLEAIQ